MDYFSRFPEVAGSNPASPQKNCCPVFRTPGPSPAPPAQTPGHSAGKRRRVSFASDDGVKVWGTPTTFRLVAEALRGSTRADYILVESSDEEDDAVSISSEEAWDSEGCADWEERMDELYGEDIRDWPRHVREEHDFRNGHLWLE